MGLTWHAHSESSEDARVLASSLATRRQHAEAGVQRECLDTGQGRGDPGSPALCLVSLLVHTARERPAGEVGSFNGPTPPAPLPIGFPFCWV